jgi:dolichyl-phosphate-mannose-protein mannosyltransferase
VTHAVTEPAVDAGPAETVGAVPGGDGLAELDSRVSLATRVHTSLYVRLVGTQAGDAYWGWMGPVLITLFGGFIRFFRLGDPSKLVFDEAYYVRQGVSMLLFGYEQRWIPNQGDVEPAKLNFEAGTPNVFQSATDQADFVVHPPLGKWMIALGERIFGMDNPFGWRFVACLCGTLSILMIARIGRRLFGSTLLGCVAGLLLAIDGNHIAHSRTALLDIFVMFWALAAFGCLLIDRDKSRAKLAALVEAGADLRGRGPWLGMRWWRIAGFACIGATTGVKWSGIYFGIVFGLMTVLWDLGARRAAGIRQWWFGAFLKDALQAGVTFLLVVPGVYLLTWTGWFVTKNGWDRHYALDHPDYGPSIIPAALRSLWHYHHEAYKFHIGVHDSHPYMANPWSWIVSGRPTAFWYDSPKLGEKGCKAAECTIAILPIGNPVIWWGGALAIFVLLFCWALRRDWRAGAILAGLVAGYLPWFQYQDRTIFQFYAIAFNPWVVLAVTYVIGLVLGKRSASPERRFNGAIAASAIVIAACVLFVWFYPINVGIMIPKTAWEARMWLPSWI